MIAAIANNQQVWLVWLWIQSTMCHWPLVFFPRLGICSRLWIDFRCIGLPSSQCKFSKTGLDSLHKVLQQVPKSAMYNRLASIEHLFQTHQSEADKSTMTWKIWARYGQIQCNLQMQGFQVPCLITSNCWQQWRIRRSRLKNGVPPQKNRCSYPLVIQHMKHGNYGVVVHWKLWFSIVMLVYQRVHILTITCAICWDIF